MINYYAAKTAQSSPALALRVWPKMLAEQARAGTEALTEAGAPQTPVELAARFQGVKLKPVAALLETCLAASYKVIVGFLILVIGMKRRTGQRGLFCKNIPPSNPGRASGRQVVLRRPLIDVLALDRRRHQVGKQIGSAGEAGHISRASRAARSRS